MQKRTYGHKLILVEPLSMR